MTAVAASADRGDHGDRSNHGDFARGEHGNVGDGVMTIRIVIGGMASTTLTVTGY